MMIVKTINQACQAKDIRCLHAIESGSRAWGFASLDSDYDVRLIYCHGIDWYLQIYPDKDTFEFIQNDLLEVPFDIGGWELKKALQLLNKSNAVIFEWLYSPIVYQSDDKFLQSIQKVATQFFDPKAVFYHYQGMAKTASAGLNLDADIKLKKWFYLLRALLASIWVIEQNSPPPVSIHDMFILLTADQKEQITKLIHLKAQKDETYRHDLSLSLKQLTLQLWQDCQNPKFSAKKQGDIGILNDIFKQTIAI